MSLLTSAELAGVLSVLSEKTGKKFDPKSFNGRKRIQKVIYLLKAQGHPFASSYRFNLYLRGPYSPDLTKDYYDLMEQKIDPSLVTIPDDMIMVVREAIEEGDAFLESVATIHSIYKTNAPAADKSTVIRIARNLKSQLSHHYDPAWEFLVRAGMI